MKEASYPDLPVSMIAAMQHWPDLEQIRLVEVRALFHEVAIAAEIGRLNECLKWGQPAWRPRKGGTTLRLDWRGDAQALGLFVDCKTDLCARMQHDFPEAFDYAAPRALYLATDTALPKDALRHLAEIAFRYKRVLPVA